MGGGDTIVEPQAPAQPRSTQETTRDAIRAQIDSLPDILKAQQEYGPQFSQEALDALREFGPDFAEEALKIQGISSPEVSSASKTLDSFLKSTDDEEFNRLLPDVVRNTRAAQSQRGLGDISPLGSIEESTQIEQLRQNLKNRRLNIALSTAGRQPISGIPTTSGTGQLVQNVDPQSIFNRQNAIDSFNANIYGTQASIYGNQVANQQPSIYGQIVGGIAGASTGGFGTSIGSKLGGIF